VSPSTLAISRIGPESDVLLRNLFEHYIHDLAGWFEIDTKADGSYSYDTSSVWRNGYDAYLAKAGDSIAGFALVGSAAEWLGDIGAHDIHEFFVIRRFRRRGFGQRMATLLWNEHPGEWLVRVLEANAPAVMFGEPRSRSTRTVRIERSAGSPADARGCFSDSYPTAPDFNAPAQSQYAGE
jgi:predicted acetyltransferase